MLRKNICMLLVLLALGIFATGMTVFADETEAGPENILEYKELGFSVKDPAYWEGLKGSLLLMPVSTSSVGEKTELYMTFLIYLSEKVDVLNAEDTGDAADKMAAAGLLFCVKGGKDQLLEEMKLQGMMDSIDVENLVQVGEADGYQFFLSAISNEEYASSLEEEYVEEYSNLPALLEKELKQAQYFAPVDPMSFLEGKKLSFTSTDLDGNTVTSEDLFKDNEITMVNVWGVWCHNCVEEMEELARIHTRLKEKGCGVVGVEAEMTPDEETYQEARDLMNEKGTNYPNVLVPEDNEILKSLEYYPTTFFVDREGVILAEPVVGAQIENYEPTLEALLKGISIPETES